MDTIFAEEACNVKNTLPTYTELKSAIDTCTEARKNGNPNSITDFVCPQGNFFHDNNQAIDSNSLPYIISVNIALNKTEVEIKKYIYQLQKNREADPVKWINSINTCNEKIKNIYTNICQFGTLEKILNSDSSKPIITNTNTNSNC